MMKKPIFLLFGWLFSLTIPAQSYKQLWKDVENASSVDKPLSALKVVDKIMTKAKYESDHNEMLKAWTTRYILQKDISPDSARAVLQTFEKAVKRETDTVRAALYHSALGVCYEKEANNYRLDALTRKGLEAKMNEHFQASLAHPEMLVNVQMKDYLPLLKYGKESRWFGDDLLHMLFSTYVQRTSVKDMEYIQWADKLIQLYRTADRREAVLVLSLNKWKRQYERHKVKGKLEDDASYKEWMKIYKAFEDLNANVLTCNEIDRFSYDERADEAVHNDSMRYHFIVDALRKYGKQKEVSVNQLQNLKSSYTQPSASLSGVLMEGLYPQKEFTLQLSARNAKRVVWRLTPIATNRAAYDDLSWEERKKLAEKNRHKAIEYAFQVNDTVPYIWSKQTVKIISPKDCGMYMAELIVDGKCVKNLYVSVTRLAVLKMDTEKDGMRLTIVDLLTGHPVPNAQIIAYDRLRRGGKSVWVKQTAITTDSKGQAVVNNLREGYGRMGIRYNGDEASPLFYAYRSGQYALQPSDQRAFTTVNLYTERAIYRPGQKLQFSGVEYTQQGDDCHVEANKQLRIVLYNAQYKVIDSLLVVSDEYGAFTGSFALPKVCLPGEFRIEAQGGLNGWMTSFRVEEYKRPTFTVQTEDLKAGYRLGDTVRIEGKAMTYSGVAVSGAKVSYQVECATSRFYLDRDEVPQLGEAVTDSTGRFVLPVALTLSSKNRKSNRLIFFDVKYTVTAENGESVEGSTTIKALEKAALLDVDMPKVICRGEGRTLPIVKVRLLNAAGKALEGKGTYRLQKGEKTLCESEFCAGDSLSLKMLKDIPSGDYSLVFTTDKTDTDTVKFTIFNDTDTHLTDIESPLFYYEEKAKEGEGLDIFYASKARDAIVFSDLIVKGKIIESRQDTLDGQLRHYHLTYKDEYGDGALLMLAMMNEGNVYSYTARVEKPAPDKRLLMKWTSFRSRLTPGQKEVWKMQIVRPDGSPAKAQMLACLYDASLDALTPHRWMDFGLNFYRQLSYVQFDKTFSWLPISQSGSISFKYLDDFIPAFTSWNPALWRERPVRYSRVAYSDDVRYCVMGNGDYSRRRYKGANKQLEMADMTTNAVVEESAAMAPLAPLGTEGKLSSTVKVRKNFAETAFFRPNLRTDENGEVSIAFTLPESTTQWNFRALAHDEAMNNGRLDTSIVVNKEFTIAPSMPRFVREGDQIVIPVNVTNLSAKALKATVEMVMTADETGKSIFRKRQTVNVEPDKTAVCSFSFDAKGVDGMLVCRTVAEAGNFSDGEEHYLPVLSRQTEVTRSLPFSLTEKGSSSWRMDTLFYASDATHKRLTIEMYANPTWLAALALPALAKTEDIVCTYDWASRLYGMVLGQSVIRQNPTLVEAALLHADELEATAEAKAEEMTDNMPWLKQADEARQQAKMLAQLCDEGVVSLYTRTAIDKLGDLQDTDGSFSWYPGMKGNRYTTVDVAILLARMEMLTDYRQAHSLLTRALTYLDKKASEEVKYMKDSEKRQHTTLLPSEWMMRYLYLNTIANVPSNDNVRFILSRATTLQKKLTIYGKALMAVVMARTGKASQAKALMESIVEHTSYDPQRGRFFDTEKAQRLYSSYRILTQCASIEALRLMGQKEVADEMCLWLMQAKRTQLWENPKASACAVFALLANEKGNKESASADNRFITSLADTTPLYFTLYNQKRIVAVNAPGDSKAAHTTGYYKKTFDTPETVGATSIKVDKRHDGLSWGCVYASFMTKEVATKGSGMQVSRCFEVKRGNEWKALTEGKEALQKGDIVRQVFSVNAETDYDFVELSANRPSCLNPRRPLSGFSWIGNLAAYRAVHDERTDFFIEKLSKGTHRFSEEYVVEKEGSFSTGSISARCVYAPEFNATCKSLQIQSQQ